MSKQYDYELSDQERATYINLATEAADRHYPKGESDGRGQFITAVGIIAAEVLPGLLPKARTEELDSLIGIYNRQNEPNGEFKAFGQMTKQDVARLFSAVGERIRELEAAQKGNQ